MSENKVSVFFDFIDPESHQIREVSAHFGLAMYMAQVLERTLALALATVYGPGPGKLVRHQYDALLESNFQKTLGALVKKLRKSVPISEELEALLSESLRKRNWLAHNYFWERAVTFNKEDGRQSMIKELKAIVDYFERVDAKFSAIIREWGDKHGVTQEIVENEMSKLLRRGNVQG